MKDTLGRLRGAALRPLLMAAIIAGTMLLAGVSAAFALDPVNTQGADKLAIHGHDAVGYFADGKAEKGAREFAFEYGGALYLFASAAHRDAFAAEPAKYLPQYGGYCAYAVAKGGTADIDPGAWTVKDGKLYLNYSASVRATWLEHADANIAKADANWPRLLAR